MQPVPRFWTSFALCLAVLHYAASAQTPSPVAGSARVETPPVTAANAAIAGKVVDAKTDRPLAHALVSLSTIRPEHTVANMYSADDGSFRFNKDLVAGKYRLEAQASGYIGSAYLQHGPFSTAIVVGAGVPTDALVLRLRPAAYLSGRVTDESGDPVPHATVLLFRQSNDTGKPSTRLVNQVPVDDTGSFEFGPLAPGRLFLAARGTPWYAVHPPEDQAGVQQLYRVSVDPQLDVAYPTVFFPAALNADGATPIDVSGGEQITANFQMLPQHAVSITLHRSPGARNSPPPQLIESLFGSEQPVFAQFNVSSNEEVLRGIPPGHYQLREFPVGGNRPPVSSGTIDVSNGSATQELRDAPELASATVTVSNGEAGPLPPRTMVTLLGSAAETNTSVAPNEKAEAEFQNLPPGEYRLRITAAGRGILPVGSLLVNGHPVPDQHLRITGGAHFAATATLSGVPVTVEGVVQRDGKPVPAALVLLVPAGSVADPDLFRRDQSDLDGSFSLASVAPGKYLLIAVEDGWSLPWDDLHALEPYLLHAQPVVIASGRATTLHLAAPVPSQTLR